MRWTVVVPFKAAAERKSRLAPAYDAAERLALSDALYRHVIRAISGSGVADDIILLSPAELEPEPPVRLWLQRDKSLNVELGRIRDAVAGPLMVVNADLPLLQPGDLATLAEAARATGCALAADRHQTGTNAVALLPNVPFGFAFGPDSFRKHLAFAERGPRVVQEPGLSDDLDTLSDVEAIAGLKQLLAPDVARLLRIPADKGADAALAAGD